MPSGERVEQEGPAAAGSAGRRRQASPRALAIAGGVLAALVVAVVLGITLAGGSKATPTPAPPSGGSRAALPGAAAANALFKGIPQHGLVLGKPSAPVDMEMFIDLQCPVCKYYEVNYLPTIVRRYIRTGKVQLHLEPWAFIGGPGSQSFSGRLGLIAASFQNKGFEFAKVLYDNQGLEDSGWLTDAKMAAIARSVDGLDVGRWQAARHGARAQAIAHQVDALANSGRVDGTPTIFVGRTGGTLTDIMPPRAAPNLQITEDALDHALGTSA